MVRTLQVTLGAGVTPVFATGSLHAKWAIFQNNAIHNMRLGDTNITTTRGILLFPNGGSFSAIQSTPISNTDLAKWSVIGTAADLLDVIYDDGL